LRSCRVVHTKPAWVRPTAETPLAKKGGVAAVSRAGPLRNCLKARSVFAVGDGKKNSPLLLRQATGGMGLAIGDAGPEAGRSAWAISAFQPALRALGGRKEGGDVGRGRHGPDFRRHRGRAGSLGNAFPHSRWIGASCRGFRPKPRFLLSRPGGLEKRLPKKFGLFSGPPHPRACCGKKGVAVCEEALQERGRGAGKLRRTRSENSAGGAGRIADLAGQQNRGRSGGRGGAGAGSTTTRTPRGPQKLGRFSGRRWPTPLVGGKKSPRPKSGTKGLARCFRATRPGGAFCRFVSSQPPENPPSSTDFQKRGGGPAPSRILLSRR